MTGASQLSSHQLMQQQQAFMQQQQQQLFLQQPYPYQAYQQGVQQQVGLGPLMIPMTSQVDDSGTYSSTGTDRMTARVMHSFCSLRSHRKLAP